MEVTIPKMQEKEVREVVSRRLQSLVSHLQNSAPQELLECQCCSNCAACDCSSDCVVCKCSSIKTKEFSLTSECCSGVIESKENPNILDKERQGSSFTTRELTYVLDGSKEMTETKELMASMIESDPVLRDDDRFDLTRPQARERTMEKVARVIEMWSLAASGDNQRELPKVGKKSKSDAAEKKKATADAFWGMMSLYDPSWATRIGVHYGLFFSAFQGQGTEEQQKKYMDDIQSMKIIGCYAMTELGHGSYIRGFETTSTYDKKTQEFIINSPTDTSTKWWIGLAGQTATHTVAFARLIIDEKDYGVHSFLVPLRSMENGTPLPGISVGDCGAKMGRNGLDNGWIQFHNVRVPRDNMLMRWAQVSPDGVYTKPPKAQLSYGALLAGRVTMIQDSSDYAKKALTIAIRYSAVRRQFPDPTEKEEQQILNYQSHQFRLMPLLATCYALHFTAQQTKKKFEQLQEDLETGDITNLGGVHATSAGLKAFSTWWCNEALEQARQCLGGHGYSAYAALSSFLQDFAVMCSWEGDNTVMAQQLAKFLMKTLKHAKQGKKFTGFEKYLQKTHRIMKDNQARVKTHADFLKPDVQLQILRRITVRQILKTSDRLNTEKSKGRNKEEAWNDCMMDLIRCARLHCDYFVLHCFIEAIEAVPEDANGVKRILKKLCDLQAVITIDKYIGLALEDRFLNSKQSDMLHELQRTLCKQLRKDAIPLVDAFNLPDFVINSPLGRADGDVYKHYLETVKKAPNAIGVAPYWEKLVKPMLKGNQE